MTGSPFAGFACSHLQQPNGKFIFKHLVKHGNMLKFVKLLGTTSSIRPSQNGAYPISVIVVGNAARSLKAERLGFVGDLLIGLLEKS